MYHLAETPVILAIPSWGSREEPDEGLSLAFGANAPPSPGVLLFISLGEQITY